MRNLKAILAMTTRAKRRYVSLCLLLFLPLYAVAQPQLNKRYDVNHPVVIIGDWDKPPYEFLNDNGEPAGSNIDVMSTVMNQLGLP